MEEHFTIRTFSMQRTIYLVGLVSREFAKDRGMPEDFLGIVPVCR